MAMTSKSKSRAAAKAAIEQARLSASLDLVPYERALAKKIQGQYGWYDEHGVRQGGLAAVVRYFWKILEPETPFVDGWVLWSMIEHLEACARGEIGRLCINIFPGGMKSLLINVFFPAWLYGPMRKPHLRFLKFSYSSVLSERDNGRLRTLLESPEYQALYGDVFKITNAATVKLMNDKQGWAFASSVGGVGTGERADFVLCFPADQLVATELGAIPIGKLVDEEIRCGAWSYNFSTGKLELQPITGWHKNPGRELVRVTTTDGRSVVCTRDHEILTTAGWVEAAQLRLGDTLLAASGVDGARDALSGAPVFRQSEVFPPISSPNAVDGGGRDPVFLGQISCRIQVAVKDLAHRICRQVRRTVAKCAVPLTVRDVVCAGAILQITRSCVSAVAVLMANLLPFRTWAYEGGCNEHMHHFVEGLALSTQRYTGVAVGQCGRHEFAGDCDPRAFPPEATAYGAACGDRSSFEAARQAFGPTKTGHFVPLEAEDGQPDFITVAHVENLSEIPDATFCVTVAHNHNLLCCDADEKFKGYIITSNCDDLHNVKDVESDVVRQETIRFFRESISSRFNDLDKGTLILIGQRVHAADVSGLVLGDGFDYTHLMIPWEYDPLRQRDENDEPVKTCIGWSDPRTRDRESAWPARFSDAAISRLKAELGPYGFASQFQQSPAPRGGGIIQREWFKAWQPANNKYPPFNFCLTAVDCAATQKASSDYTGCTTWAIFNDPEAKGPTQVPAVILVDSWKKRLQLSASETIPRLPHEVVLMTDNPPMKRRKDLAYMERCGDQMGLVEWVSWTAKRYGATVVLIENEKTGLALGHELRRLYRKEDFSVWLQVPKGDKYSRLLSCQALFANGRVYAPIKPWAEELIDEVTQFPYSKYKDLTDSTSMALTWLRNNGLLQLKEEVKAQEVEESMYENVRARHRQQHTKLYPC